MTFTKSREAVTVAWILAVAATAVLTRPLSIGDGAWMVGIAAAGIVLLRWFWRRPDETLSESINNARR